MIPAVLREIEVNTIGSFQTKQAGISKEGLEFIIEALSDNLYSNIINTIVREYTSNMMDAIAIENKLDKPCYIIFSKNIDDNSNWIEFKDYGSGMTPEFMNKVFMNWGDSTKRSDNIQIGGWGLGSKCGLAYQDQIYITTIVNGNCWEYILYKTESLPELILLNSYVTDQPNGSIIKIEIKKDDRSDFIAACRKELLLFKNVIVIDPYNKYNNDFKIYEHDLFYITSREQMGISPIWNQSNLYISNGSVLYPIDISKFHSISDSIGIGSRINRLCNTGTIIIKANIGELDVTLSRESLKYTDKTNKTIIDKIIKLDDYFDKYITDYFSSTLDAISRAKKQTFAIYHDGENPNKSIFLDFKLYIEKYYNTHDYHFFECSQSLLQVIFGNKYMMFDKYKFYIDKKYLDKEYTKDREYMMRYFNLESMSSVLSITDKFTFKEYRSINLVVRRVGERVDDTPYNNVAYAVLAKQQIIRSVKTNFINFASVPAEYIEEQKRLDLEALNLRKKLIAQKALETRKANKLKPVIEKSIVIDDLLSIRYDLKSSYYTKVNNTLSPYVFDSNDKHVYGKNLIDLDYIVFIRSMDEMKLIKVALRESNLNVIYILLENYFVNKNKPEYNNRLDFLTNVYELFHSSNQKDIQNIFKLTKTPKFIKTEEDFKTFIQKNITDEKIKEYFLLSVYSLSGYLRSHLRVENCLCDLSKTDLSEVKQLLDYEFVRKLPKIERDDLELLFAIPKYNKMYQTIEKKFKIINPIRIAINHLTCLKDSLEFLTPKHYESLYYYLKNEGITNIKSLNKIKQLKLN